MRRAARLMVALAALVLAAALFTPWGVFDSWAEAARDGAPATGDVRGRLVVLVSVDGLAPRFLAEVATPRLDGFAATGLAVTRAETIAPPVTLPSHASMLTGLPPAAHGITWNRYEPWGGTLEGGVFARCAEAGLRCGLFAGKRKFVHLGRQRGVERYRYAARRDDILAAARDYIEARDPRFVMVHLPEVDTTGHREGWGSAAQRAEIEAVDAALGAFSDHLQQRAARPVTFIVTADHGGDGTEHHRDVPANRHIPWIAWGDGIPTAALPTASTLDTASTILALLALPPVGEGRDLVATAQSP